MLTLSKDLKYGLRMLARNPGFAAVTVFVELPLWRASYGSHHVCGSRIGTGWCGAARDLHPRATRHEGRSHGGAAV
jgi:hypothetical protein